MEARTPRLGRPARLSREQIVEAALGCDLRIVTMRDIAKRLGVSHSALYRWVGNRDDLLDLVSEVVVERILPPAEPTTGTWRQWLSDLAWRMHDQFLAVPGYAAHVAMPHRHNPHAFGRLRDSVVTAFKLAGVSDDMAEQSWHIFGLGIVQWLGAQQPGHDLGPNAPRFDLFLDVLLRGLPAQEAVEEEAESSSSHQDHVEPCPTAHP